MIRRLEPEDRELFLEMSREFYSSEAVLAPIPDGFHEDAFNEVMRSGEYMECFILESGGETAGYALLNRAWEREAGGTVIWLEELYVRPQYRGAGLGGEVMKFLDENVPAARYRLEVEPDNEKAMSLYKRNGWEMLPYLQMVKIIRKA